MNIWLSLAFFAGICATIQSAINGQLSKNIGAAATMAVNGLVFFAFAFAYFGFEYWRNQAAVQKSEAIPWVQFLGGMFGFGVVLFLTLSFPRVGALVAMGLALFGQLASALLVDHFSLFGMPQVPISLPRVLGIVLIMAGTFLLKK